MKRILFVFLSFLLINLSTYSTELVATPTTLVDVYNTAADGDIILLDEGVYINAISFPAGKSITLKGNPAAATTPVLNFQLGIPSAAGGSMIFNNLIIDRAGSDYFFNTSATTSMNQFNFVDCQIRNIKKALFNATSTGGTITQILMDNCVVSGSGTATTGFINSNLAMGQVTIQNSTINNYVGGNFVQSGIGTATSAITFLFKNNTVYKSVWDNTYSIFAPAYSYLSTSTYSYINNILDSGAGTGTPRLIYVRSGGIILEKNNIKIGYASNYITGTKTETLSNLTLGSGVLTGVTTIPYKDAVNGDFSIPATSPIATAGDGGVCVGAPVWIKAVSTPVTIATSVSPTGAGTASPASITINKDESTTLSATPNFGYHFANWTDASNNVVSTNASFSYTASSDAILTANFVAIPTYELNLTVNGGANSYMVQPIPSGTMVNGKRMYEDGTEVSITTTSNSIINFLNWEDNTFDNPRTVTMNSNKNITANYVAADYIVGWDFYLTGGSSRKPDFYSTVDNSNTQFIVRDEPGNILGWLDKSIQAANGYIGLGAAVIWKQLTEKHYFQTMINASEFQNIHISSKMGYNYNAYKVQQLQWSKDGSTWNTAATATIPGSGQWVTLEATLPVEANNAAQLYVRWIPDFTAGYGDVSGTASTLNGIGIAAIYVTGTKQLPVEYIPPVLLSTSPANNATNISSSGKVILTFDEKIKLVGTPVASVGDKTCAVSSSATTLWVNYAGLQYDTEYTFTLPANSVSDLIDNVLTTPVTFKFRTMQRPVVTAKLFDYIVKPGDATDLKAAIAAANAASGISRYRIFVPAGFYDLGATTYTTISRSNVSLIGAGIGKTIIQNKPTSSGIGVTATLYIPSSVQNTYIQDITIKNAWPYLVSDGGDGGGVAVAFQDASDKSILKNVQLKSYQDTYFSNNDNMRSYYEDCQIHGTVDFICGPGNIYFNRTFLYLEERNGCVIVAPRGNSQWGYVFNNCTIGGLSSNDGTYRLGRPWGEAPKTVYLNTTMNLLPTLEGWGDMGPVPSIFAEYNSRSSLGLSIDCSQRKTIYSVGGVATPYTGPTVLSDVQASQYSIENVLSGTDGWIPTLYTEQVNAPNVAKSGSSISWNLDNYTLCYLVFKDGQYVAQTTGTTYALQSTGNYTVYAANEMGGLSPVSNTVTYDFSTGVEDGKVESVLPVDIYTIDGRVILKNVTIQDAYVRLAPGLYIAGGKKLLIMNNKK